MGVRCVLFSRRGHDWTKRPADALQAIPTRSTILDTELAFPGADGAPDFYGLQAAMGNGREHELAVYAFDVLHLNGEDLRPLRLIERQ